MTCESKSSAASLKFCPCILLFVNVFCFPRTSLALSDSTSHFVRTAPGSEYAAGSLHRFLFGDLWREAWIDSVDVEVLDLERFAGGLTLVGMMPSRASNTDLGNQSDHTLPDQSLLFSARNGAQFSYRLLDRGPAVLVPSGMQALYAPHILDDLVAATHPYADLIATPLLNAAGIIGQQPKLVALPESDRLGRFRHAFSGRPGILELIPNGAEGGSGQSASQGATRSTIELLRLLASDHRNRVNAVEFLKTRIMDLFIGDRNRSFDQWQWKSYGDGIIRRWEPVALCRDQAFSRYGGLVPWVGSLVLPELEGYGKDDPPLAELTWSGRHLDRRILSPLNRAVWDSVTTVILSRLTDSVIAESVRELPALAYGREGTGLMQFLRSRRAELPAAVDDYYHSLAATVDIVGSNGREYAEVVRTDNMHVDVRVCACNDAGTPQRDQILFHRVFSSEDTGEIRLHMLGGDDAVILRGTVESSIPVLVIGGEGNDRVTDSSHVGGYLFSLVPFVPDAETETYVYDSDGCSVREGPGTEVDRKEFPMPANDTLQLALVREDRGNGWGLGVMFDANSQLGLIAGLGPIYYRFGFRKDPYATRLSLLGGYAPFTNVGRAVFNADFRSILRNTSLSLEALASGYEVFTYYGQGNETAPVRDPNDEYYRVHQFLFKVEPGIQYPARGPFAATLKTGIRYVRTDPKTSNYVMDVRPYGVENMVLATVSAGVRWDTRDVELHAHNGVLLDIGGTFFPKAFTAGEGFGKARCDMRLFISPGKAEAITMSLRVLGEKSWGKVPYFEAPYVGSSTMLRGYQQGRFSGSASLAAVCEARIRVGELSLIFPTSVGLFGFVESGRVFVPGEASRRWHPSFGGGIWAAPWNRETTMTASLAFSDESALMYASIGFGF